MRWWCLDLLGQDEDLGDVGDLVEAREEVLVALAELDAALPLRHFASAALPFVLPVGSRGQLRDLGGQPARRQPVVDATCATRVVAAVGKVTPFGPHVHDAIAHHQPTVPADHISIRKIWNGHSDRGERERGQVVER